MGNRSRAGRVQRVAHGVLLRELSTPHVRCPVCGGVVVQSKRGPRKAFCSRSCQEKSARRERVE